MLKWYLKDFDQLSSPQLYAILKARQDVFIIEQACIYPDIDSLDMHCLHLFCIDTAKDSKSAVTQDLTPSVNLLAYLRIIPPKLHYPEASMGRVLTSPNARGLGLGKELISLAIDKIKQCYPEQDIKISAQYYLLDFYQSFGFEQNSSIYLEDGIEHIEMLLTSEGNSQ